MSHFKKILEYLGNGGLYSEPPSSKNKHHIKSDEISLGGPLAPYLNSEADLENADIAADELVEFFKFTVPADSSVSATVGKPKMSGQGYGKGMDEFGDYDPSEFDEQDLDMLKGRMDAKAKSVSEARGDRVKVPRADFTSKNGWQNGLPVHDEKDLKVADFVADLIDDDKGEV